MRGDGPVCEEAPSREALADLGPAFPENELPEEDLPVALMATGTDPVQLA